MFWCDICDDRGVLICSSLLSFSSFLARLVIVSWWFHVRRAGMCACFARTTTTWCLHSFCILPFWSSCDDDTSPFLALLVVPGRGRPSSWSARRGGEKCGMIGILRLQILNKTKLIILDIINNNEHITTATAMYRDHSIIVYHYLRTK